MQPDMAAKIPESLYHRENIIVPSLIAKSIPQSLQSLNKINPHHFSTINTSTSARIPSHFLVLVLYHQVDIIGALPLQM